MLEKWEDLDRNTQTVLDLLHDILSSTKYIIDNDKSDDTEISKILAASAEPIINFKNGEFPIYVLIEGLQGISQLLEEIKSD